MIYPLLFEINNPVSDVQSIPLSISSNLTDIITTNEYESEIEFPKNNPILSSLLPSSDPHSMIPKRTSVPFNADTPRVKNNPINIEETPHNQEKREHKLTQIPFNLDEIQDPDDTILEGTINSLQRFENISETF